MDTLSPDRRVHFRDGVETGCDAADDATPLGVGGAPLAEWIFIDRDSCGISLYNYDPQESHLFPYEYFHSSVYGRLFHKELSDIHEEQRVSAELMSSEDLEQERGLDIALKLAGVEELLVQKPEAYTESCQEHGQHRKKVW